jgi:hypothetical protein
MRTLASLLEDERVRVLVTAANHAHSALTLDISLGTQRKAAENLAFALTAFATEESDTCPAVST